MARLWLRDPVPWLEPGWIGVRATQAAVGSRRGPCTSACPGLGGQAARGLGTQAGGCFQPPATPGMGGSVQLPQTHRLAGQVPLAAGLAEG